MVVVLVLLWCTIVIASMHAKFVAVAAIISISLAVAYVCWMLCNKRPAVERLQEASSRSSSQVRKRTIHCIMITGKDDCRLELARLSVQNFREQDYENKCLIIVNHHPTQRVLQTPGNDNDVKEVIVVKRPGVTLGALRNMALDMVPDGELWTVWDDDDWRSPAYLSTLHAVLTANTGATAVAFTDRLEYNHNTGLMWAMRLRSGFVTLLAEKLPGVRYLGDKDSMEDVTLKAQYGDGLVVYDNNKKTNNASADAQAGLYVRLVHGNNTSLYVNKNKTAVVQGSGTGGAAEYTERDVTAGEAALLQQIISNYFSRAACLGR